MSATATIIAANAGQTFANLITDPSAEGASILWNPTTPSRTNLVPNPSAEGDASLPGWAASVPTRTNVALNPSAEIDATTNIYSTGGYLTAGSTVSRSTAQAFAGAASAKVDTAGTAQGVAFGLSGTYNHNSLLAVSVWLKGAVGGEQVEAFFGHASALAAGPANYATAQLYSLTTSWQKFTFYVSSFDGGGVTPWNGVTSSSDVRLHIRARSASAMTFYADGVIVYAGTNTPPTVYFDGDTPGYGWTGVPHASTSSNTATITNLVTKPRFEDGLTTGWAVTDAFFLAAGGTATVAAGGGYLGTKPMQVDTTATTSSGVVLSLTGTFKSGVPYTATFRMRGNAGGEALTPQFGDRSADRAIMSSQVLTTGWVEYRVTWTPSADRTNVGLCFATTGSTAVRWFVDAVGVFASSNNTGYFDGTFPGASWTSTAHASTSTRSAAGVASDTVGGGRSPGSYASTVLAEANLVSYLKLTDATATAADSKGANTGTYVGAIPGVQLGALFGDTAPAFAAGYVNVPDAASLRITGDLTLEAWVRPTDRANYYFIVTKCVTNTGGRPYEWRLETGTGLPLFGSAGAALAGSSAPPVGVWSHIAVTRSGTTITHYLNGVANGTGSVATTTDAGTPLRIGTRDDLFSYFNGRIAHVAIYNAALSGARMTAHYAAAPAAFTGATTGAWWMGAQSSSASVLPALTQSSDWAAAGTKSFRLVQTINSGETYSLTSPTMNVTAALSYAAQMAANVSAIGSTATVRIRWSTGASTTIQAVSATGVANWSTTASAPGGAISAYIEIIPTSTGLIDMYFDAVAFMQASAVPTYFDGDSLGYNWKATPHNSQSTNVAGVAVTNLVTNPGFESNTTGWVTTSGAGGDLNNGATIAQSLNGLFGSYAALVTTTNALAREGASYLLTGTYNSGVTVGGAVWMKGAIGGEVVELVLGDSGGDKTTTTVTLTTAWQRFTASWTPSSNRTSVTLTTRSSASAALSWFVDGAIVVLGATVPDYFDGDTPGAVWTGTRGASTSTSYQGAVLNLVQNPSFESGVAGGWTNAPGVVNGTGALSQVAGGYVGTSAMQTTTLGGSTAEGPGYALAGTFKAGVAYTATVRIRVTSGTQQIFLRLGTSGDSAGASSPFTATTTWTEQRITWTPTADAASGVYVAMATYGGAVIVTMQVDAVGVYQGSGWTGGTAGKDSGYFDGSFPNASWTGTANASISKRDPAGIINLVPNPGAEVSATVGWTTLVGGNAFTRDTSTVKFGSASFSVTNASSATDSFQAVDMALQPGTYQFSGWVKNTAMTGTALGPGFALAPQTGTFSIGSLTFFGRSTALRDWTQVTTSFTCTVAGTMRIFLTCGSGGGNGGTAWWDGVILTTTSALPAFFSGENSGAFWGGAAGNSYSILPTLTRDSAWSSSGSKSFRLTGAPITGEVIAATGPTFSVTAGLSYSAILTANARTLSGTGATARVLWSDGTSTSLGAVTAGVTSPAATAVAPGGVTTGAVKVVTDGVAGVADIDFDAVIAVVGSTPPTYFDGSSYQASWTGAANASTSVKTVWGANADATTIAAV